MKKDAKWWAGPLEIAVFYGVVWWFIIRPMNHDPRAPEWLKAIVYISAVFLTYVRQAIRDLRHQLNAIGRTVWRIYRPADEDMLI